MSAARPSTPSVRRWLAESTYHSRPAAATTPTGDGSVPLPTVLPSAPTNRTLVALRSAMTYDRGVGVPTAGGPTTGEAVVGPDALGRDGAATGALHAPAINAITT